MQPYCSILSPISLISVWCLIICFKEVARTCEMSMQNSICGHGQLKGGLGYQEKIMGLEFIF